MRAYLICEHQCAGSWIKTGMIQSARADQAPQVTKQENAQHRSSDPNRETTLRNMRDYSYWVNSSQAYPILRSGGGEGLAGPMLQRVVSETDVCTAVGSAPSATGR